MLIIGSHVNFKDNQLVGCVNQMLEYGGNTFMFYTGAPQNTIRKKIDDFKTLEAYNMMKEHDIRLENIVCHAPYIINLANNKDIDKYQFSINFLIKELERCKSMGIKNIVLHPGSAVGIDRQTALRNIIYGLNIVLDTNDSTTICLETMAGKGTELGIDLLELKTIIDGIEKKEQIGICLDTCHLSDSGVDLSRFDEYLDELDKLIGLDKVKVIHINDSKNGVGSRKDRHENIGYGTIGFDNLLKVIYNPRLSDIPKILETPYIGIDNEDNKRTHPPYKFEIEMIKSKRFNEELYKDIRDYYQNGKN